MAHNSTYLRKNGFVCSIFTEVKVVIRVYSNFIYPDNQRFEPTC